MGNAALASERDLAVVTAYELANNLICSKIQRQLKRDPAQNLLSFLQQLAASYDEIVADLSAHQDTENYTEEHDELNPSTELRSILFHEQPETVCPVSQEIIDLAMKGSGKCYTLPFPQEFAQGLNTALLKGEILSQQHGTFVISLGSKGIVKIIPESSDADLKVLRKLSFCVRSPDDDLKALRDLDCCKPEFPAPLHQGILTSGGRQYIFMRRNRGQTLDKLWPRLQIHHKLSIQDQLNTIFTTLRSWQRYGKCTKIGDFRSRGICKDMRRSQRASKKAIETEHEFNRFICQQRKGRPRNSWAKSLQSHMTEDHRIVATHGALHPRNILVDWNGKLSDSLKVTCILDWELGGWYPEYWEFVTAHRMAPSAGPLADWSEYLPTGAIGSWLAELSLDTLIGQAIG